MRRPEQPHSNRTVLRDDWRLTTFVLRTGRAHRSTATSAAPIGEHGDGDQDQSTKTTTPAEQHDEAHSSIGEA